jgi:hypothetical protein
MSYSICRTGESKQKEHDILAMLRYIYIDYLIAFGSSVRIPHFYSGYMYRYCLIPRWQRGHVRDIFCILTYRLVDKVPA